MSHQTGNLSTTERAVSAFTALALSVLSMRRGNLAIRIITGAASAALLARAYAGHCAVKAAMAGHTSLAEGVRDQWDRMSHRSSDERPGLPGSPAHTARSNAVDESVDQSFPASDPPASHIPDVPPVNADAKWAAARLADRAEGKHQSADTRKMP